MIRSQSVWPSVVAHADMDAFYAAIEQRDDPALRGRPVLVGSPSDRGVVLTASYEARPYGVGSAMPMAKARRLCPDAVIVPPRFDRYQEISETIMGVFANFSPRVEASPVFFSEKFRSPNLYALFNRELMWSHSHCSCTRCANDAALCLSRV
jgi:impB/mucB/samB family